MSELLTPICQIESVRKHSNADRLDVCRVKGLDYQFIYERGVLKENDIVVYFPIDTILPENLISLLGLKNRLSGPNQNRIKTMRLRGEISQGVVTPISKLEHLLDDKTIGTDVSTILGVQKYEAPEIMLSDCIMKELPKGLDKYDIENADMHQDMLDVLMNVPCLITEKMEGSNWSITHRRSDNCLFVNTRNHTVVEKDNISNTLWDVARNQNLIELIYELHDIIDCDTLTIYGEIIGPGINGNIYKLSKYRVMIFDIKADHKWVDADRKIQLLEDRGYELQFGFVPILGYNINLIDWLNGKNLKDASHGQSQLGNTIREGIVITPMHEITDEKFRRIILKQRDPIYLCGSDS